MTWIILAVFGLLSALLAKSKGRSPVGWFFVGFFLGLLGLILILIMSDLKKQNLREQRLRDENRRLRERVLKDRNVADQRYQQLNRRVGAHDRLLDIDTGSSDAQNLLDKPQQSSKDPSNPYAQEEPPRRTSRRRYGSR